MRVTVATESSRPERPNEDFVGITDDLVVVLDGTTVPRGLETGCRHGTRWFARRLGCRILGLLAPDPGLPLTTALARAIEITADQHGRTCDVDHPGHPSSTVAILRETEFSYEYLVLGDSSVVLDTRDGPQVVVDNRVDAAAPAEYRRVAKARLGSRGHGAALVKRALALREQCNVDGGYWVASVDPQAAYHAITGTVSRSDVGRAAVLTDGASIIADRFDEIGWSDLLDTLAGSGPAGLIRRVRDAELADQTGQRWPRDMVHDDATVAYCEA